MSVDAGFSYLRAFTEGSYKCKRFPPGHCGPGRHCRQTRQGCRKDNPFGCRATVDQDRIDPLPSLTVCFFFLVVLTGYKLWLLTTITYHYLPIMNPNENIHWIYDQSAPYSSLDEIVSKEPSNYHGLPTIPKDEWELGWDEDIFSYAPPEQVSSSPIKETPAEAVSSQVLKELSNLSDQVQQLRRDISELQDLCTRRLDSLEKMVIVTQHYVNDLVPWSIEVHDKYTRLLEVAERQDNKTESMSTTNVDKHSTKD